MRTFHFEMTKTAALSAIFVLALMVQGNDAGARNLCESDPGAECDVNGRVIYGSDDRKDWHELGDAERLMAGSSVSLFASKDVVEESETHVKLRTTSLKEKVGLCVDGKEAFADQQSGAFCSGVLVASDKVLTAGHCLRELSDNVRGYFADEISFVFGFHATQEQKNGRTRIPKTHVFVGREALDGEKSADGTDWGLVQLDRAVPEDLARPVAKVSTETAERGQKVFVIGYPTGLPLKFARNAEIRDSSNEVFFVANLDTYGGNSGSPVYDQEEQSLLGLLVRGDTDYVRCKQSQCFRLGECECETACLRSNVCPTTGCRGEDVMRISEIGFFKQGK
ncbi:MAG: serine protease [Alphaproteobacteria bacterium]|nr:serine protease [Alphaproteobacteria bacterium]